MPGVTEVQGPIDLLSCRKAWHHSLIEEMIFKIAEVVGVSEQKIGERKASTGNTRQAGEACFSGGTKIKGSTSDVGLTIVVAANLDLQAELILMTTLHHGDARRKVELRIPVLDETLPLRTHNIVGHIGHTGCRRGAHECG